MRLGVFCTYENPFGDFKQSYQAQIQTVRRAEALGFEEAWVAEHHFDPDAASPSILVLLAHLAGVTSRIRLGSAAVLLAFRNPVQVAEDVATIDILSNGRFDFGVAKGGPFPLQNKHFHARQEQTRDMTIEALELINRLLYEVRVSFRGEHYEVDNVALVPKPLQRRIPTFLATSTSNAIEFAARSNFGLMAASPFPLQRIVQNVDIYRAAAPGVDPRLALARFYYAAATRKEALDEAIPFIRRFADRMRGLFLAQDPGRSSFFDEDAIVERSLIGSFDEVRAKIIEMHSQVEFRSLLLKPATFSTEKALLSLEGFVDKIRPHLCGLNTADPVAGPAE
jgi:alkanesulfonate monooxygenase SsuD/methylene tetrahydromethanopterin reductase-like flavin-dependent oxidoreductase (luciferase family)